MAAAPVYFATAKIGHCRITSGVAATDGSGSGTAITWYNTAPAGDWMLTMVTVAATSATGVGDLADSLLHMWVDDGSTARLIRTIDLGNPTAGSVTAAGYMAEIGFGPQWVFPSTVLPEFTISVSPTAGNLDLVIFAQAA